MPQKRNPLSIEAETRFRAGERLIDIAISLGKPAGTVRRWKSDQNWEGSKKQTECSDLKPNGKAEHSLSNSSVVKRPRLSTTDRTFDNSEDMPLNNGNARNAQITKTISENFDTEKSKTNSNRLRGGQPGNKNGLNNKGGIGAPLKNKYALRTGEYETINFDELLDAGERALINADYNKYTLQFFLIDVLSIRERRIMQDIRSLRDSLDDMALTGETENESSTAITETKHNKRGERWAGPSTLTKSKSTSKTNQTTLKRIVELEDVLTRIQARKQRAIEILHRIELDDIKTAIDLSKLELAKQRLSGAIAVEDILDGEVTTLLDESAPDPS
ncbi:MAG: hypothetical protein FWC13_07615 [Oscillospiraceae bacterium]|nr:hypothetical protein [Oscillospiraceae bacterium]